MREMWKKTRERGKGYLIWQEKGLLWIEKRQTDMIHRQMAVYKEKEDIL